MKQVRVAGVPEHFNYPWQIALEDGIFSGMGIDLQWKHVPEGTGKISKMLRDGDCDMAVILTEGIVKDITDGNPSKIVQQYVGSPLIWGIHVAASSQYYSMEDLQGKIAAISRYGSGSHLMAYINAKQQGWQSSELKFEVVNTIDGAVDALTDGRADYFMWERFMTKPLCDSGIFRRIADCPTPWPCFVIAVRNEFLESDTATVKAVLEAINSVTAAFKQIPGIETALAEAFKQKPDDIAIWLSLTSWSGEAFTEDLLNKVQNQLAELSLIDKKGNFAEMVQSV